MKEDDGKRSSSERYIAKKLGLTYEEYTKFIILNRGFEFNGFYYFETEKECKDFIEKIIEPRLIMEKINKIKGLIK